jgi:hypothetical protein
MIAGGLRPTIPGLHAVLSKLTLTPKIIPGVIHKTDTEEVARAGIWQ